MDTLRTANDVKVEVDVTSKEQSYATGASLRPLPDYSVYGTKRSTNSRIVRNCCCKNNLSPRRPVIWPCSTEHHHNVMLKWRLMYNQILRWNTVHWRVSDSHCRFLGWGSVMVWGGILSIKYSSCHRWWQSADVWYHDISMLSLATISTDIIVINVFHSKTLLVLLPYSYNRTYKPDVLPDNVADRTCLRCYVVSTNISTKCAMVKEYGWIWS